MPKSGTAKGYEDLRKNGWRRMAVYRVNLTINYLRREYDPRQARHADCGYIDHQFGGIGLAHHKIANIAIGRHRGLLGTMCLLLELWRNIMKVHVFDKKSRHECRGQHPCVKQSYGLLTFHRCAHIGLHVSSVPYFRAPFMRQVANVCKINYSRHIFMRLIAIFKLH